MMKDAVWVYAVCGFLAIIVIAGGSSLPSHNQFMAQSWISLALLLVAVWRLRWLSLDSHAVSGLAILAAGFGVMFLQLVPLPQTVWSAMGGRAFVVISLESVQQTGAWLSLSLSPNATRQAILALLPGAAIFIAMFSVSREGYILIAFTICALAMVSLLLSLVQLGGATVSAGFINPNFFAALLYMSIPFALALGSHSRQKPMWVFAAIVVLLCLVGVGQTGSRIGLLLALGITVASALSFQSFGRNSALYILPIITVLIVVLLLFGGAGLERFMGLQTALAARAEMFSTSLIAMLSFLPTGSGFGSFVPVYQIYEAPTAVTPSFVNHAHNDWLELLLEGGLLMAVLMVTYLRWFANGLKAVWVGQLDFTKAASISASAVLLHSFADYPLRTPALLALFACCCGFMLQMPARQSYNKFSWNISPGFSGGRAETA